MFNLNRQMYYTININCRIIVNEYYCVITYNILLVASRYLVSIRVSSKINYTKFSIIQWKKHQDDEVNQLEYVKKIGLKNQPIEIIYFFYFYGYYI